MRKKLQLIAAGFLCAACLCSCAAPQEGPQGATNPSPSTQVSPTDQLVETSRFVLDEAKTLTAVQMTQIDSFCKGWEENYGETICFAVTTGYTGQGELYEYAEQVREAMGGDAVDTLALVDSNMKNSFIAYGPESQLTKSGIIFSVSDYGAVGESILKYCQRVENHFTNKYLELGQGIAANFDDYTSKLGFILIDVTDLNSEEYPDSTVKQAGDGHIELYCLNGSENDAGLLWGYYYDICINHAKEGTFVQSWDPEDYSAPCFVEAVVNGQYIRADLVGGTCVIATTFELGLRATINGIFTGIGVPTPQKTDK